MSAPLSQAAVADAHARAGEQHLVSGEFAQAVERLEASVGLSPASAGTFFLLASAQTHLKDLAAAERAARTALELDPDHAGAAHLLGAILCEHDRFSEALVWLRAAVDRSPGVSRPLRDLAVCELFLGDLGRGRDHLAQAVALDPHMDGALLTLVRMTDMGASSAESEALLRVLEGQSQALETLALPDRAEIHYALAKAYEDRGEPDKAFAWLQMASDEVRATLQVDISGIERRFGRVEAAFAPATVEALRGQGVASNRPIFIFGMPRSGTTLIEQIVSAHPNVQGAGEIPHFQQIMADARGPGGSVWPAWVPTMVGADLKLFAEAYLSRLAPAMPGQVRTTDKRLDNLEFIGLLDLCFPNASFIHCRRDPRDAIFSTWAMRFTEGQEWSYDLAEAGRYWRAQARLMAHWKAVLPPGRMLEVDYEAVVADPLGQTRRLLDHCALPWSDACLRFQESRRPVKSASFFQVRQPIYSTAVGRWRAYARHLAPTFQSLGLDPELAASPMPT